MENEFIKKITKLNLELDEINIQNLSKTEMILPLLLFTKNKTGTISKEIEKNIKVKTIKKLDVFKFEDYFLVSDKIDNYLTKLTDEIIEILPETVDVQSISFLLYELVINIYKHSKFEDAYIQIIIDNDNIKICIIDDGIGIPGSFDESSIQYPNDCDAIFESINGKTTDKEKFNLHGRGLNTSARITTLGFEGEMIISSGSGICYVTSNGAKLFYNKNRINGTFIILNINNKKVNNIYECLKYKKINKLEVVKNE